MHISFSHLRQKETWRYDAGAPAADAPAPAAAAATATTAIAAAVATTKNNLIVVGSTKFLVSIAVPEGLRVKQTIGAETVLRT